MRLWALFLSARVVDDGEMSMPRILELELELELRLGYPGRRREARRREMQPVPVQRSRM